MYLHYRQKGFPNECPIFLKMCGGRDLNPHSTLISVKRFQASRVCQCRHRRPDVKQSRNSWSLGKTVVRFTRKPPCATGRLPTKLTGGTVAVKDIPSVRQHGYNLADAKKSTPL
jgi:hypothetical protein